MKANHQLGETLLCLYAALVLIALVMIVPTYTYTTAFWVDTAREVVFNFTSWGWGLL